MRSGIGQSSGVERGRCGAIAATVYSLSVAATDLRRIPDPAEPARQAAKADERGNSRLVRHGDGVDESGRIHHPRMTPCLRRAAFTRPATPAARLFAKGQ